MPVAVNVPPSLSLEALKKRLDITRGEHDEVLGGFLEAAFEQAQAPWPDGCGRLLLPDPALVVVPGDPQADPVVPDTYTDTADPVTRSFPSGGRRRVLIPDARSIEPAGVVVDGAPVDPSSSSTAGYELLWNRGHVVALMLPSGTYSEVFVTGRFGFATLPPSLREAIYTLASRMWHERAALQSDTVAVVEGAGVQYLRQLPPRVKLAFSSWRVPAGYGGA